jgi:hypothetical protein
MNKEQLFDLTERVKLVAGVELPVIVGSQSLYAVTSHVPDIVKRSVECDFLLLAVGPPAFLLRLVEAVVLRPTKRPRFGVWLRKLYRVAQ